MSILTRPILKISLENLAHNYRVLKNLTSARPAAVVKADAYGLGAEQVVTCLKNEGCDAFFVAHAFRLTPVIGSPQMLSFWSSKAVEESIRITRRRK